jgi:hypothetical protein
LLASCPGMRFGRPLCTEAYSQEIVKRWSRSSWLKEMGSSYPQALAEEGDDKWVALAKGAEMTIIGRRHSSSSKKRISAGLPNRPSPFPKRPIERFVISRRLNERSGSHSGATSLPYYRQAADRDRAQGIRNYRAVLARLDERTGLADWRELVDRARQAFEERDGTALVDEARGRLRLAVLDMDGVSADDAEAAVAIFDESLDRLVADGLDGAVSLLRERLERGLSALESPTMGRQLASPITQNQTICIGIVSGVAVILAIICAATPYCWCCWGWVIIAQLVIAIGICLAS